MARLRLGVFAPYLPAPAHSGGRIRILQLATALARHAELHLFAAADPKDRSRFSNDPALAVFARTHFAHDALAFIPNFTHPARVRRASPPALRRAFARAQAQQRFNALVVEHSHAAGIALAAGLPWVLDEHNVESDYVAERRRAAGGLTALLSKSEVRALARFEHRAWQAANTVVCVSAADAEHIGQFRSEPACLVPNGVALRAVPFSKPSDRSGYDIVFVGLMGHAPNAAAARWLASEVMPLVWAQQPEARLTLCGADPPRDLQAFASNRVEVTGRVDSVVPYLQRASVYANPLQEGAGTSLKVLEALASGLPLVSTACGVRGFPLQAPRDYLSAEEPIEFARALLTCLADPAARDAAAIGGRVLAEAYDWDALGERFAAAVLSVCR